MEDLLFKNIPAEGFDPNCGFTDRISNPTPSRSNTESATGHEQRPPVDNNRLSNVQTRDSSITGYSDVTDRLSNATPSRRNLSTESIPQSTQSTYNDNERMSSTFDASRASNPTPSRRVAVSSSSYASPSADDYSRASNPTPTRRFQNVFSESPVTFPNVITETEDLSRASNPTPTRRSTENIYEYSTASQNATVLAEDVESRLSNTIPTRRERECSSPFFDSDTAESLTFESADNPYGVGVPSGISDSRASNPTPTRRTAQTSPVQEEGFNFDNDRLSNYTPSQHK